MKNAANLLRAFEEAADRPPPPNDQPGPLIDLVGKMLLDGSGVVPPGTPLRPRHVELPGTTRLYVGAGFGFSYPGGYQGCLQLGWTQPYVRKHPVTRRIIARIGWEPNISWSMWRQLPNRRFAETHHEWHDAIALFGPTLTKVLCEILDPEYALKRWNVRYVVTAKFVSVFEDYVAAYLERPTTIEWIKALAED